MIELFRCIRKPAIATLLQWRVFLFGYGLIRFSFELGFVSLFCFLQLFFVFCQQEVAQMHLLNAMVVAAA